MSGAARDAPGIAEVLRARQAALYAERQKEPKGRRWLNRLLAERAVEATASQLADEDAQKDNAERRGAKRRTKKKTDKRRRRRDDSRDSSAETSSTPDALEDESAVRKLATDRPGALLESAMVLMLRQAGGQHARADVAGAAGEQGLCVGYLTRALLPQVTGRITLRSERELRTLAEAIDLLLAGRVAALGDVLAQRFRAVEASILEEGGWSVARHLEVIPDTRVSSVPDAMREVMARAERDQHRLRTALQRDSRPGSDPSSSAGWARTTGTNQRSDGDTRSGEQMNLPSAFQTTTGSSKGKGSNKNARGKGDGKGKK